MSVKRQATTKLDHNNWDQDDPSEHEEMGTFQTASKDVLEKRVIRTAKRRNISGDEQKKGVFSGFGGFNKTQPSSFDFLANLTNGSKNTNGSADTKTENTVSTGGLFSSKSPLTSLFTMPNYTSSPTTKSTFGTSSSQTSLFSGSSGISSAISPLPATNVATANESPFKIQSSPSNTSAELKSPTANVSISNSGNVFGAASAKSLFSTTSVNAQAFNSLSNMSTTAPEKPKPMFNQNEPDNKSDKDEKKMVYYSKLKGLNESVSDWIKKHVDETPLCILSPIFKDYEKHLKVIQDEYFGTKEDDKTTNENTSSEKINASNSSESQEIPKTSSTAASVFTNTTSPNLKSPFNSQNNTLTVGEKSSGFSFGMKTSVPSTVSTTASTGFSFGVNTTTQSSTAPFSLSTTNTFGNTPSSFSFGTGKPFTFNSNIQKKTEENTDGKTNDDEDEPPKVEFTPVVEDNSVYDKRCKIFVKKDGNFVDKGVGTLYIKKIEDSGKHQLLIRANTNLGNILVNLILTSAIPTQRMGKNNVMLVCIPTPDTKPPPTPILIRVKTSEEADELLETLNKYKA